MNTKLEICVKCGTCRTTCPVFRVTRDEGNVARGKISLLQILYHDAEHFSEKTLGLLNSCVACGSCQFVCPLDVPFLDIIMEARSKAVKDGQVNLLKKLSMKLLSSTSGVSKVTALMRLLPGDSGLIYKIPLLSRHLPKPEKTLDDQIPHYSPAKGEKKFDVLYFPGCSMRYVYSTTAIRLVHVLNVLGVGVYVDTGFKCCGLPHISSGETVLFDRLQQHNSRISSNYEGKVRCVVTACATCGASLKNHYDLTIPVWDINELLPEILTPNQLGKLDISTRYHHPCHLLKQQDVQGSPEALLAHVSNFEHMDGADFCCGFGGSFSVFEGKLSREIGDKKAEMVKQSFKNTGKQKETLITSCPGCILQLTDSLKRNGIDVPVRHIIDIIYESLEVLND